MTIEQLRGCTKCQTDRGLVFLPHINNALEKYEINTPIRMAHFLSQIGHESESLKYTEELASGHAYEGRKDLGNLNKGDGPLFKGRGLIQITGRANYAAYSHVVTEVDVMANPYLLSTPKYAVDSAGWFWHTRNLNMFADLDDITTITHRINGALNGLVDREQRLILARKALGIA